MKIAIFHEVDFGGARRTADEFSKRLKKYFNVDFYSTQFDPKQWMGNDWRTRIYKDTLELLKLYRLHKKIAKEIDSKNYDYVFVHPSRFTQAPFLLRFLKTKTIYFCQEPLRIVYDKYLSNISYIKFPKNIYEYLNRRIRKWIDKKNFENASIILANSNYSKKFIEKSYGGKAEVCYLGVDTDIFKPLNLNKTIDVLFIGNKNNGYNLLENLLLRFGNKLKIHTIFRNSGESHIADSELTIIYNKSKVLVALNHNEPFGLIPLEAMACGIPVIAVGEGGYNESMINNKTGFLISRDSQELYKKIDKVVSNEKLRTDLGKNARENVLQNWTWDKSIERFLKIIKYSYE